MARSTCKGGLDAGGSWSPGTAHFVVQALNCPLLWSKGCTNVSCRACSAPVYDVAVFRSMHSVIPGIVGGTTIGGNAAYGASLNATPPCPCCAFSDGVMFGKTPRGDGRVCTDDDEIAIWLFEVITLKGISVPYTSVVQVQGDVAHLHLDALDDLALGGSRDEVPAVREDL